MITFIDALTEEPLPWDPNGNVAGYLPAFFDERDPRPAAEQIASHYPAWSPSRDPNLKVTARALYYPGDPPQPLVARARLRDEKLRLYRTAWLAIVQRDGSTEIARVD